MRFGWLALAAALLSGGCSAQIADGRGGANLDGVDAGIAALCDRRTLYLNFEGQKLVQGTSDATLDQAEWMILTEGTAPPYLADKPNRNAKINHIVEGVREQLAQFPIDVVTTRPGSGQYIMIVFGGVPGQVGSLYGTAVNRLDCDDSRPNDVAWISDDLAPEQRVINSVLGAVGFGLGLTATTDPRDCMCGWANDCDADDTVACTLGSPIARDPMAKQLCPDAPAQQDEIAVVKNAFCGLP